MADERKVTNDDFKDVIGSDYLMQSILGKLYSILTTGSEVAPASTDNFFAWATPGYPVTPEYFEFAYLGTSGETIDPKEFKQRAREELALIKELRESSGQEEVEFDAEDFLLQVKDKLQKEVQNRRNHAASDFANLVDFVPDVSGNSQEPLKTQYTNGTLSDVYQHALNMAQVKHFELTEKEKELLERIENLLGESIETPKEEPKEEPKKDDPLAWLEEDDTEAPDSSAPTANIKKSPYMEAYSRYEALYLQACDNYRIGLTDGTLGSLEDRLKWTKGGERSARQKVESAMKEWTLAGHKATIEKLSAQKRAIEEKDFSILLQRYKDLYDHSINSVESRQYLETTLTPADFVKAGGWTTFTFSNKDIKEYSKSTYRQHGRSIKTKTGSFFHKTTTTNTENDKHFDLQTFLHDKKFDLSFDFCQVRIIRPWFKESFLSSRFWRFDPRTSDGDILSDGGNPPKGMLPAYPTSILIIRNLNLSFREKTNIASEIKDYEQNSAAYSGGLRLGCFNISAGAGYSDSNAQFKSDWEHGYTCTEQGLKVPGLQIIGYNCHMLGTSPNPNPNIKEEDWI